jgi:hypothetical protein
MSSGGSVAAGSGGGATGDGARAGDSDPSQRTRTATPDSDAPAATPSSIAVDPDSRRSSISHLPTGDLRAYLRILKLQHKEQQQRHKEQQQQHKEQQQQQQQQHKELVAALERWQARQNENSEARARCCTIV